MQMKGFLFALLLAGTAIPVEATPVGKSSLRTQRKGPSTPDPSLVLPSEHGSQVPDKSHWDAFLADEQAVPSKVHKTPMGSGSPKLRKRVVDQKLPSDGSRALIHRATKSIASKPVADLGLKGFQAGLVNPDKVNFKALAYPPPYVINWDRCPTGHTIIGCTYDVQREQQRWYHEEVKKEDRVPMTPEVCYDFCYRIPGTQFFGLQNGDRCYCTPFYTEDFSAFKEGRAETNAKWTGKGHFEGMCDMPCVGDPTRMCGGKDLISIFEMHTCDPPPTTTTTTTTPCSPETISVKSTAPDDIEMSKKSGEMYQDSSDLEVGPDGSEWGQQLIGIRFQDVPVPIGAEVQEANIEFTTLTPRRRRATSAQSAPMNANIKGVLLPHVLPWGTTDHYLSRLPSTSEVTEWVLPDFVETAPNTEVKTPDIGRVVQAVISQGAWKPGNAMAVTLESQGGPADTTLRRFASAEYEPATLTVSYCSLCTPKSVSVKIQDDRDDVEQFRNNGEMYFDSSDLELGMDHDWKDLGQQIIGLRFKKVEVPANAKILKANVEFTLDDVEDSEEPGTHDALLASIKMILQPDVQPFESSDHYLSNLPATLAVVGWSPPDYGHIPGDYGYGGSGTPTTDTPDIGKLVSEVVNHPAWESGNTMAVTLDTGTGDSLAVRRFWSAKLKYGPTLTIWYCDDQVKENS